MGLLLTGCATAADRPTGGASETNAPPARTTTLTIGITSTVDAFGLAGSTSSAGGWMAVGEIHSQGLVTSDLQTRKPVGRLAERVPSLEDGSIQLLPDGRMRVVYRLRPGVTWQDGTPFTAGDLSFSFLLNSDPGLPFTNREAIVQMDSVEAADAQTFVITFKSAYYLADSFGLRTFWPYPEHLLRAAYEAYRASGNTDDLLNLPYWTSAYVNLGPFRVAAFDPGEGLTFRAYDGYFLGRPKIDAIRVQSFADENALFSHLLAGSAQLFFGSTFSPALGAQLRERWGQSGDGTVYLVYGYTRFLTPQWRPALQREPTVLDRRVRAALYYALDREAISEAIQSGQPDLVANAILPPDDRNFEGSGDALRQYAYNPDRARALLAEVGWSLDGEGALRHQSDGRRFRTSIWANSRWGSENGALGDHWRRLGLEVEQFIIPGTMTRDRESRASYPGWETTSRYADGLFQIFEEPPAGPENRWAGNGAGFEDPRARRLVQVYRASLAESEQREAVRQLTQYVADELPILPLYYEADNVGVRHEIRALDDVKGGAGSGAPYGFYSRNAHLWEVLQP